MSPSSPLGRSPAPSLSLAVAAAILAGCGVEPAGTDLLLEPVGHVGGQVHAPGTSTFSGSPPG